MPKGLLGDKLRTLMSKKIIFSLILLAGLIALGTTFVATRGSKESYDFVIAEKGDLEQIVSVRGRLEPVQKIDLSFERSGKVKQIKVNLGEKVQVGQILARLKNNDLRSQLDQSKAKLSQEEAQLAKLRAGSTSEEITLAQTKVNNTQRALANTEDNLLEVEQKAQVQLDNLYDEIPDIINNAYVKAEDAVNNKTDSLFSNDRSQNPKLTFSTSDVQAEIDAQGQRVGAGSATEFISQILASGSLTDESLSQTEERLLIIRSFLNRLSDALSQTVGLSQATLTSYRSDLNTALTNINEVIASINGQQQDIAEQKIVNQNNITTANSSLDKAESNLLQSKDELTIKESGPTQEEIRIQQSQIQQAKADVGYLQSQINQTILRSPINGLITKKEVELGEVISSQGTIFSIISSTPLQIESNMPEIDITKIEVGQKAKVVLDTFGQDQTFSAQVSKIDPAETIIEGISTYKTTLQFSKDYQDLKTGMTGDIDILTAQKENIIVLSRRAIIKQDNQNIVRLLKKEEIKKVPVKLGLQDSQGNVEIIKGVTEGDKIITRMKEL